MAEPQFVHFDDVRAFELAKGVSGRPLFGESRPASTLVEVSRLAIPGAKIEVEAVAVVRD